MYPCVQQWFQFVSFGDGVHAPVGSLYSIIPLHIVNQIKTLGHSQSPYMCFGVYGRGNQDEVDWSEEANDEDDEEEEEEQPDSIEILPLSNWNGERIVTTRCSNKDAVIEWVFVPFIVEESNNETSTQAVQSAIESDTEKVTNHDENYPNQIKSDEL